MGNFVTVVLAVILAPIMWFVLGGPPGIVLVVSVAAIVLNNNYCTSRSITSRKRKEFWLSNALTVFLGVWLVFEIFDSYPGLWLDRMFFVEPRAFEVDLKLVVDGKPLNINRRVRCAHGRSFSTQSFFTSAFQYAGIDSFGEKLESGGAVMVVTPGVC